MKTGSERRREAVLSRIKSNIEKAKPMKGAGLRGIVDGANSLKAAKNRAHEAVERQMSRTEHERPSEAMRRRLSAGVEFAYSNKNRVGRD